MSYSQRFFSRNNSRLSRDDLSADVVAERLQRVQEGQLQRVDEYGIIPRGCCPQCLGVSAFLTPAHPHCEKCEGQSLACAGGPWPRQDRVEMYRMYLSQRFTLMDISARYRRTCFAIVCQLKSGGYLEDENSYIPAALNNRVRDGTVELHAEPRFVGLHTEAARPRGGAPATQLHVAVPPQQTQSETVSSVVSQLPELSVPAEDIENIELPQGYCVDELTCPICLHVLYEAVLIVHCGHNFCSHCLAAHRQSQGYAAKCPECRGIIDQVCPDAKVRRKVKESLDLLEESKKKKSPQKKNIAISAAATGTKSTSCNNPKKKTVTASKKKKNIKQTPASKAKAKSRVSVSSQKAKAKSTKVPKKGKVTDASAAASRRPATATVVNRKRSRSTTR